MKTLLSNFFKTSLFFLAFFLFFAMAFTSAKKYSYTNSGEFIGADTLTIVAICKDKLLEPIYGESPLEHEEIIIPQDSVFLQASEFDNGSYSEDGEIISFSFDETGEQTELLLFCPEDIGTHHLTIWVHDSFGNKGSCEATLFVQNICYRPSVFHCGSVETAYGDDIQGVEVFFNDYPNPAISDISGSFCWGLTYEEMDYELNPIKNYNFKNGLSSFDIILIKKHILRKDTTLDTPYKLLAADVNNSGTVTSYDLILIQRVILGIDTTFSNNTSWGFVNADHVFPDPENPWLEDVLDTGYMNYFEQDYVNFIGFKVGDVNGSAIPNH